MKFSVLTLFPEMFSVFSSSIISRAQKQNLISLNLVNIRDFAADKYRRVDDHPYGGGAGMIMKVDVIDRAIQSVFRHSGERSDSRIDSGQARMTKKRIILLDPKGEKYNQRIAKRLSKYDHLILVCGHYEGVDERVKKLVDESISIGDYVLTGGEIPAMVIVDSVTRLLPGVLKNSEAIAEESFHLKIKKLTFKILEYPQYTRPAVYKNMPVPKILFSGDQKKIADWRKEQTEKLTKKNRPDLFKCHSRESGNLFK